jgi:acetoacetyl-CoA synthetase
MKEKLIPLWLCPSRRWESSSLYHYRKVLEKKGFSIGESYRDLHTWSVNQADHFWISLWDYFQLPYEGSLNNEAPFQQEKRFWKQDWFPDLSMNMAQALLGRGHDKDKAIVSHFENVHKKSLCWSYYELRTLTACLQFHFQNWGFTSGDVTAAFMPNIPETILSMLSCVSLGGIFTSTSCDFGVTAVLDRFQQCEPKILIVCDRYEYHGKSFCLKDKIEELIKGLPTLKKVVIFSYDGIHFSSPSIQQLKQKYAHVEDGWSLLQKPSEKKITFVQVPFSHPLYILFSSGTTGKPKCIVHTQGGTLLQHVKELSLHGNIQQDSSLLYFTTCGWMMWNWMVSSLALGSTLHLYEGSPGFPSATRLWDIVDEYGITHFGTSPKFLRFLEQVLQSQPELLKQYSLERLHTLFSTGSPLMPEQFDFVYQHIKKDIHLASISGGTDIVGCFMLGHLMSPVWKGEIQAPGLGMSVKAFNEQGKSVIGEEGELVCTLAFPSCPKGFWKDDADRLFQQSYFEQFAGCWYHGDYIRISQEGSIRVFGRSDATLNPGGVRIGTAEIYQQVEKCSFIEDSLCIGSPSISDPSDLMILLFVKMKHGELLTDHERQTLKKLIRQQTSPRHVPQYIVQVSDIPYTRSGKKMEMLITKLFQGKLAKDVSLEMMSNPSCVQEYWNLYNVPEGEKKSLWGGQS